LVLSIVPAPPIDFSGYWAHPITLAPSRAGPPAMRTARGQRGAPGRGKRALEANPVIHRGRLWLTRVDCAKRFAKDWKNFVPPGWLAVAGISIPCANRLAARATTRRPLRRRPGRLRPQRGRGHWFMSASRIERTSSSHDSAPADVNLSSVTANGCDEHVANPSVESGAEDVQGSRERVQRRGTKPVGLRGAPGRWDSTTC
jgi:hypothetical protein